MAWLAAMALLSLLTPYVPLTSRAAALVGVIGSTTLYVWLVVRLASSAGRVFNVPRARPLGQIMAWCVGALLLWAASEFVLKPYLYAVMEPFGRNPPQMWKSIGIVNFTLRPLLLVAGATCGGVALSRLVRYPNMLGPLAGVTALIDIWGVLFQGIVSKLLTSPTSAPVAQKMMAPLPTLGGGHGAGGGGGGGGLSLISVGTGDFLFLGLFFGVLWAHSMDARAAEKWIAPLVAVALCAVALLPFVPALPGLLFIGLGATIPNLKYLRYTREENFALLYAGAFVAILTTLLFFAISSQLEEAPPGNNAPARPARRGNS